MKNASLTQRLTLVFALLLIICSVFTVWLQYQNRNRYSDAMIQRLSHNIAHNIVHDIVLIDKNGIDRTALKKIFDRMMSYNPSMEVYLIDNKGFILADAAPEGHLKRNALSLYPIKKILQGGSMPVYGDDPRSADGLKVFSVSPIKTDGSLNGYLYVILQGEDYYRMHHNALSFSLRDSTLWSIGIIILCGLVAGILAFRWVTKPIGELIAMVNNVHEQQHQTIEHLATCEAPEGEDEVSKLKRAFISLACRISEQWHALALKDQQRREFIATISHDLRTPMMSIQGYLETLTVKEGSLNDSERRRYLMIALTQTEKVGYLAQQLFELARLEHGSVHPQRELFSLADLVQDILQKLELPLTQQNLRLKVDIEKGLPLVHADMSMMESVITNLLDNAIRHTPSDGGIFLHFWNEKGKVMAEIADTGPGIDPRLRTMLFERPAVHCTGRRGNGGLGLMIVKRMLQLHRTDIQLVDSPVGACFRFSIPI